MRNSHTFVINNHPAFLMGPNKHVCIIDADKAGLICVNVFLEEDDEDLLHEILSSVNENPEDDDYLCPSDFPELMDSFSEELWYTIDSQVCDGVISYLEEHDLREFDSDDVPSFSYVAYPGMSEETLDSLIEKHNLYSFLTEDD